ncbi:MAG: ABC transporter substrate-binding protein [Coleofasciculaceae cyanobacterium]
MKTDTTQPCRKNNGLWRHLKIMTATMLMLAACSVPSQDRANNNATKIGVIMPMTGQLQSFGEPTLNSIKAAIDEINAAGGIKGKSIQLVVKDNQSELQPSLQAAQTLIDKEKVAAIIGPWSSRNTIPIAEQITSQRRIPQIAFAATSPAITTLKDNDFLFRTAPSDAFQGIALAAIARDKRMQTLGILYPDDAYGQGLASSIRSAFEARGGKITGAVPYKPGQTVYGKELTTLAQAKADALVLIGFPEDGAKMLKQAQENGKFKRYILTDSLKEPEVVAQVGDKEHRISFGTAPQAFVGTKTYIAFKNSYETKFGKLPVVPYLDTAYDATMILALAIAKAGNTDGTAIREAMREVANPPGIEVGSGEWEKAMEAIQNGQDIDYVGASGSCDFDKNGDVAGAYGNWKVENGEIVTTDVMLVK